MTPIPATRSTVRPVPWTPYRKGRAASAAPKTIIVHTAQARRGRRRKLFSGGFGNELGDVVARIERDGFEQESEAGLDENRLVAAVLRGNFGVRTAAPEHPAQGFDLTVALQRE